MLGREERQEVMRAVRQLPGRQREALVLRYYLDLPEREIARLMGLRPEFGQVRHGPRLKALGHALRSLMSRVGEQAPRRVAGYAGEVTPQSVPPLRLHGARRRGLAGPAARRRWAGWRPRWPPRPR